MPLVNTKDMFAKAYEGGYSIGAFNVNDMEIVQGIMNAATNLKAPVILQASTGAIKYAGIKTLLAMVEAEIAKAADQGVILPVALHLDHGPDFEAAKMCIDGGFTSVMIDASSKAFEENIELSKQVADYAHKYGVTVEAELGTLAGVEDEVSVDADKAMYTDPDQVQEFVNATGVDSLAIAIGTSHGAYKFKPGTNPKLRLDILEEVEAILALFVVREVGDGCVASEMVSKIRVTECG